jgi:hypothetical protein
VADPTGNAGAGQQEPGDSNSDFTVTRFIVQQLLSQLETMKLAKVVKVTYPEGGAIGTLGPAGTVDVQLLVNQIDGAASATPHGVVYGIPWFRLGGGKNAVVCDPKEGDLGYVVAADRDISNVKAKKAQANPGSFRQFSIADGVYVGGVLNAAAEQAVIFGDDFIRIVDKTGNVVEMSATGIELTPASGLPVKINGNGVVTGTLQLGGALQAIGGGTYGNAIATTGDVVAHSGTGSSVTLSTHRHAQANDSRGDVEQPVAAPTPGT